MTSVPMPEPGSLEWAQRLASWMRKCGRDGDAVTDVGPIRCGTQNLLIRFTFGASDYVLRQPPPTATDGVSMMAREGRVLAALAGTDVPHAALIGIETGPGVLDGGFLVTAFVEGFNAVEELPEPVRDHPAAQLDVALAVAEAAAAVAIVDPAAVGLADLGRAPDWTQRQVARWTRVLNGYSDVDGYPGDSLAAAPSVHERLTRRIPDHVELGLLHGDLHCGNMVVAADGRQVAAVVDWELATLGDPRLDLAHLVATWPGTLDSGPVAPGWTCTDTQAVIERYAEVSGRTLDEFEWFRLLAAYRMAILLEGSLVRSLMGVGDPETARRLHAIAVELLDRILESTP